ncbi:MAG: Fic family protein [Acidobacteriota bacterium]
MSLAFSLKKAAKLKSELDYLRPLKSEVEDRVLQKIRLEWNFNSVAGERNALTLEETKSLILHGITKGSRPLKDYIEMKIHNDTISWMFEIAPLGFVLTEDLIKQIHESILLEPYEVESFDKDGKPVLKMVEIGKYKQSPNSFKRKKGKIGEFATPEETPERMKELLDWYSAESQLEEANPIVLAAEFHYRFVKIQPFDDANGRIARILTNLILMQFGYPPIAIKQSEKNIYHFALQTADTGNLDSFIEFINRNVVNSLELYLKGARGESIEEVDDLEKDLVALEEKLRRLSSKIVKREKVVLLDIFDKSILPLLSKLMDNYAKFDRFYIDKKISINVTSLTNLGSNGSLDEKSRTAKNIAHLRELLLNEPIDLNPAILIVYVYTNFNRDGFGDVAYNNKVIIRFDEFEYTITEQNGLGIESNQVKKYSEELFPNELEEILSRSAEAHKRFIEEKILGAEVMDQTVIELEIAPLKLKTI